jgi:hypothetical protein
MNEYVAYFRGKEIKVEAKTLKEATALATFLFLIPARLSKLVKVVDPNATLPSSNSLKRTSPCLSHASVTPSSSTGALVTRPGSPTRSSKRVRKSRAKVVTPELTQLAS